MANLVARKANETMVARMVGPGGVCFWRESGVRLSDCCWCIWREFGFSCREDVFKVNILREKFYKFCTYKVNVAIN
jgi:hypothetical protein